MGPDIQNEVNNGQTSLSEKILEHANKIANAICPEVVEQEEGTVKSEYLSLAANRVENALMIYTVPFQKKVLQIVMDNFPAKEVQYEQEVRRQEADDALLNATTEWPTEEVEALVVAIRNQKNG